MVTLGERISYYRKNANITQAELPYRLGGYFTSNFKVGTKSELCRNLQTSADVLLETECGNLSENKDAIINDEIRKILRDCEEPFNRHTRWLASGYALKPTFDGQVQR